SSIAPLFQTDHVGEARQRVPERTVGAIDKRRALERRRLLALIGHLVEVRVVLPRQRVKPALERVQIHLELPLETEDLEIVRHVPHKPRTGRSGPFSLPSFPVRGAPDLLRLSPWTRRSTVHVCPNGVRRLHPFS